ncbi:MAG: hypothetical protein GY772_00825 [bacterium]|nr:hypothetical protein [bacterium]
MQALSIAADPEAKERALKKTMQSRWAPTTEATNRKKETFLRRVAQEAGLGELIPLTKEKIYTMAAILREAGFRSAPDYLSLLKKMQLDAGVTVPELLSRELTLAKRAASRGKGPAWQAAELLVEQTRPLREIEDSEVIGSADSWVVAHAWLLRESELAMLVVSPAVVRLGSQGKVEICIEMSKTDQEAKGARRELACSCKRTPWCGPCAVRRQLRRLEGTFGWKLADGGPWRWPLFPNLRGKIPTKKAVVEGWQRLVKKGETVKVSGHSGRRSGAKAYARAGWQLWQVQFVGRWGSKEVKRYTQEAFAERVPDWEQDPGGWEKVPQLIEDAEDVANLDSRRRRENQGVKRSRKCEGTGSGEEGEESRCHSPARVSGPKLRRLRAKTPVGGAHVGESVVTEAAGEPAPQGILAGSGLPRKPKRIRFRKFIPIKALEPETRERLRFRWRRRRAAQPNPTVAEMDAKQLATCRAGWAVRNERRRRKQLAARRAAEAAARAKAAKKARARALQVRGKRAR